jgi:hypothetical protein
MADYCTLIELKAAMNKVTAPDDATLTRTITAVSCSIDNFCNRPSGFIAEPSGYESTRYFFGTGKPYQWIDECVDVVSVAVKDSVSDDENAYIAWVVGTLGSTLGADVFPAAGDPKAPDYVVTPYTLLVVGPNGDYSLFPKPLASSPTPTVQVKARWGYAAIVPPAIKQATIMQSARWYKLLQGAMARALASPDMGVLTYPGKLDPDVEFILTSGRYVKVTVGR